MLLKTMSHLPCCCVPLLAHSLPHPPPYTSTYTRYTHTHTHTHTHHHHHHHHTLAFFCCYVCKETKTVEIDRGRIAEPAVCPHCQSLHSMALIHNRSLFTDKQMIKLQESPGERQVIHKHHLC